MTQIFLETGKVIPVTVVKVAEESVKSLSEDLKDKPVLVSGLSRGKGFTGVMKRWNFHGQQATRGQSDKPRAAGSIGAQTPGKVFKGKKMAGHHGNKKVTILGLKIVRVVPESQEIMVSGPVPGARNTDLVIKVM